MNDVVKNIILWLTIALIFMSVFSGVSSAQRQPKLVSFDEFIQNVRDKNVLDAEFEQNVIRGQFEDRTTYYTVIPTAPSPLIQLLLEKNVKFTGKNQSSPRYCLIFS